MKVYNAENAKINVEGKKVLITVAHNWGLGGVQTFLTNVIEHLNKESVQIDIYAPKKILQQEFLERILDLGIRNMYIGENEQKSKNYNKNVKKDLVEIIKKGNYDVIHSNTGDIYYNYVCTKIAKRYDIKNIIVHSHNAFPNPRRPDKKIKNLFMRTYINKNTNHRLACSRVAGNWMFSKKYEIINNGIDIDKFIYNEKIRKDIRKQLNIEDKMVVAHIGSFNEQKNHEFLIEIFNQIHIQNNDAILLLFGKGEKEDEIKEIIKDKKLGNYIKFMGTSTKINEYLQAIDLFILPSLYEGLGIVLIEAQTASIPCIASDNITKEVKITNLLKFLSLHEKPKKWAEECIKWSKCNKREDKRNEIIKANYDIKEIAKRIEEIYTE